MKFAKFAKSVAPDGFVYTMGIDAWLTNGTVWMKVPAKYSVAGQVCGEMPDKIRQIITNPYHINAFLHRAELPEADSKIKDAVRYYSAEYKGEIGISNDAWSLMEAKDRVECGYIPGEEEITALLVFNSEDEIVGAVLNVMEG